jgi:hypothetical protein
MIDLGRRLEARETGNHVEPGRCDLPGPRNEMAPRSLMLLICCSGYGTVRKSLLPLFGSIQTLGATI